MKFFPFWNILDYHNPEVSLQPAGCIHAHNEILHGAKISSIVGGIM